MCLNPITIVNPSKYISKYYRSRYLLQVPCNHCAECAVNNSAEWFFRTFVEFQDIIASGNFVYFDTLTYDEKNLPRLRDRYPIDSNLGCFDSRHLRNFIEDLRIFLKRKHNVEFRQFVSSEYGSKTGRPHYHILLFVRGAISPVLLSAIIAEKWKYGRTDGWPYKSANYVYNHNYIHTNDTESTLLVCNYVTKYVQKSCIYTDAINKRVEMLMYKYDEIFASQGIENWLSSVNARRMRSKIRRNLSQFHRQSQGFGASILQSIDLSQLYRDGCFYMPHFKRVKVPVKLSTYYKRKLFYDLIEVDGTRVWKLNDDGKKFQRLRQKNLSKMMLARYQCLCKRYNLDFDCEKLVDYVMNHRGMIKGQHDDDFIGRVKTSHFFNYVTLSDREHIDKLGVYLDFRGNNSIGYDDNRKPPIPIKGFIARWVYLNPEYEKQLDQLFAKHIDIDVGRQNAYKLRQRLTQLFKQ